MRYLLIGLVFLVGCQPSAKTASQSGRNPLGNNVQGNTDLAAARQGFVTQLKRRAPAPQEYENEKPPAGVKEVEYSSGDLKLKGWLSADVGNGGKRPAVVFLHGGFAFGADDWQDAEPFAKAGLILFMPMLRGENGNPGIHESFLGEVDDAIAAGRYVAGLPQVDSSKVFVCGHSVGGGLTCLVSMMPSPYKAAASFDGMTDMRRWSQAAPDEAIPYDRSNAKELELRNPFAFVTSVRIPLKLYAGPEIALFNLPFFAQAKQAGKDCELVEVPGDHQAMVKPAVQKTIVWFKDLAGK